MEEPDAAEQHRDAGAQEQQVAGFERPGVQQDDRQKTRARQEREAQSSDPAQPRAEASGGKRECGQGNEVDAPADKPPSVGKEGIDDRPQTTCPSQFANHREPRRKQRVWQRDCRRYGVQGTVHRRRLLLPQMEVFALTGRLVPGAVLAAIVMAAERCRRVQAVVRSAAVRRECVLRPTPLGSRSRHSTRHRG